MSASAQVESELTCPLSLELLEDPVSVPCCGRTFSRAGLASHLSHSAMCPFCRADIPAKHPAFDVAHASKNLALAALVDMFKARSGASGGTPVATAPSAPVSLEDVTPAIAVLGEAHSSEASAPEGPEWTCHLTQVC